MQYALWIRHCISPTFHLCGHMDSKFKMRPVCVAFRNTWEENVPLSSVGSFLIVDHPLYLIFFRIITTCTERVCTQRVSTCTEHVINMY